VIVSVPITGRTGKARVSESLARKRQAVLNIKRTEVELYSAIDTALRDIAAARERGALVKDSVRFATDAYKAEEKRLASGLTTSYNVANQLKEFSQARTRALAAEVDLQKALTQLYLVQGVLSTQLKIDVVTTP
jgi:outer membrane protein TolC